MEIWIPLLVALVGGTGIFGTLTAATQISRRARLRRSIDKGLALLEKLPEGETRAVLEQAVSMDVLRLSAMSIVSLSARAKFVIGGFIIAFIGGFGTIAVGRLIGIEWATLFGPIVPKEIENEGGRAIAFFVIGIAACYIVLGFATFATVLQLNRERIVLRSIAPGAHVVTSEIEHYRSRPPAASKSSSTRRKKRGVSRATNPHP